MGVVYLDTSALLKQYVAEPGSDWLHNYLATSPTPTVLISVLTTVEATCAFSRRLRDGTLTPPMYTKLLSAFDYDVSYRYYVMDVVPGIVGAARHLAGIHPLRAYDAIQLASAWSANGELSRAGQTRLTFISADDRLLAIAQAEGLSTDNPNHHL